MFFMYKYTEKKERGEQNHARAWQALHHNVREEAI